MVSAQSRLVVCGSRWMWKASIILLLVQSASSSFTVADSHYTWCPLSHVWTAMPFFWSFFFTADLKVTCVPASQAGFRKGRSCTDNMFAKCLLCSTTIMYDADVHHLCLNLSKAFDAPTRDLILQSIQSANNGNEDTMHITTTLMSNSSLSVHVKDLTGRPFKSTVGGPQGDSFSPVAFTTTFEMVLQQTRSVFPTTPSAGIQLGIPMEMQYDDDTDFISTSHSFFEDVLKVLDTELPPRHLICNTQKTQRVHVCRESEEWKKTKTLGALLSEEEDVTRQM